MFSFQYFYIISEIMTNLDSILKSRDITLPTKVHLVKAMVSPAVTYGCEIWNIKKAAATAKSLQSCPTLCDPIDRSPLSLGFSRQEPWSGLPLPSPMHESEKRKWSRSVVSDPQRPSGLQPTRLLRPWDFPGKSIGLGCHCLLRLIVYNLSYLFCLICHLYFSIISSPTQQWPLQHVFPPVQNTIKDDIFWILYLQCFFSLL